MAFSINLGKGQAAMAFCFAQLSLHQKVVVGNWDVAFPINLGKGQAAMAMAMAICFAKFLCMLCGPIEAAILPESCRSSGGCRTCQL